jgi:hypothetical protein
LSISSLRVVAEVAVLAQMEFPVAAAVPVGSAQEQGCL